VGLQGQPSTVVADPCVVLARFAGLVAKGADLPSALDALVQGLGLRSAVLRSAGGELLAAAGDVLRAVSGMRSHAGGPAVLELPVPGRSGVSTGTLTVTGARPSQLPALRTAAALLGLAQLPPTSPADLLDAAEEDHDDLADALHDGAVQTLVVARYAADAAVRGADAGVARDAVQRALVDVRRHLWHLRPRGSEGLAEALRQLSAQRVDAGQPALRVVADADLHGTAGVTAYRLVQVVSRGDAAVRVGLRAERDRVVVDVAGGAALPAPERWARRARALGGDLSSSAGRLRLVLPFTDARTAP
jgi:signal transduction histidine kinase